MARDHSHDPVIGAIDNAYEYLPEGGLTAGVSTETTAVSADGEVLGICRTLAASDYNAESDTHGQTAFVAWLAVPPNGGEPDAAREHLHAARDLQA